MIFYRLLRCANVCTNCIWVFTWNKYIRIHISYFWFTFCFKNQSRLILDLKVSCLQKLRLISSVSTATRNWGIHSLSASSRMKHSSILLSCVEPIFLILHILFIFLAMHLHFLKISRFLLNTDNISMDKTENRACNQ